jgi:proteasome lid subunit RPN8/RPN11
MTPKTIADIRDHAARSFPRESCGVVIVTGGKQRYVPCRNIASGNDHFRIHPEDFSDAEDLGVVIRIVHSHPNAAPTPSEADLVSCEATGVPWLIINHPVGHYEEFKPSGYKAGLIGREFSHGVLDCYALIRDYYSQELGVDLPNFERDDDWWLKGGNLYLDNFSKADFVRVDTLEKHDVLLMQIGAPIPNHAAVYAGENQIIHHCAHRLSSRDVFGGIWHKCTTHILRHRTLLCAK